MNGKSQGISEDWLSLIIGLIIFVLALGLVWDMDLLGWVVTTKVWTDVSTALAPVSKAYAGLGGVGSLIATYVGLLVLMTAGAAAMGMQVGRFIPKFTVVFFIAYACWIFGSWAHMALNTPEAMEKAGITWSLRLTAEGGFVVALIVGLIIGNFLPGLAEWMKEAIRPELYIKIAIVILGGFLGIVSAEKLSLATELMFLGLASIIVAYLIFWSVVYYVARVWFKFSREWAAPLASGISVCGVSAAIATGGAIRARPFIPIMVSSLVVIFAVIELLILPFIAGNFLDQQPMAAGAWMALSVKTDGAAVASGSITESLILAKAAAQGIKYQPGWILGTAATVKVFIDIFIGVWAFVLAWIWTRHIEVRQGDTARVRRDLGAFSEVHYRLCPNVPHHPAGGAHCVCPGGGKSQGGDGRSQCLPWYFLRADVLHHRRHEQFPETLGRGHRPVGRGISSVPVRIRYLGGTCDFAGFLCRRQTATHGLKGEYHGTAAT